jgi:serine/threonine-protein kinase
MVVAGVVVVLGLVTYGWSLAVGPARNQANNGALPLPAVVPATGKCVVSYAVWSDVNGKFNARVTVANRNDAPIGAWKLWFIMPGDQVLSGKGKVRLTQQDNTVTVSSTSALASRKSVTLPISGRYKLSNATPLAFTLNDHTCETFVSRPGETPRRVEHLSDGGVRLAPTTSTPAPGVSIDPGGVVHITPTTTPPSSDRPTTPTPSDPPPTTKPTNDPPPPSLPGPPPTTPTTPPTTATTAAPPTPPHTTPPTSPPIDCDPVDPTCNGAG